MTTASVGLGANVGMAWVAVRFSARGAAKQIQAELASEGELAGSTMGSSASKKFGSSFSHGLSGIGNVVKKSILPVSIAITAIGVESVKAATTFQTSMLKVRTQAGASQKEVTKMSKAVLSLASASQQGPQELADSLYHLESLGLRGAKAIDALKISMKLAAVSGADLEQASSAIGGAWRTGIVGAKSFSQSAATLNAIVGAGNMRMSDLLGALGTGILPAAKTFGLNLKQVGSALALFTDEGVPAVDAATRLRMTFSLLGAPSQLAIKQLGTIGLSGTALANAMRSPGGLIAAIQLLKDHLDASGKSATEQAALLSRAFGGGRSSSAILSMLNNLGVLKKKQDQVNSSVGKFGSAVEAQSKTSQAKWKILESTLEAMSIKIGNVLIPFTTTLVQGLDKDLLPAIGKAAGAFERIIPVDKIKSAWVDLLKFLGVNQPKFNPIAHLSQSRAPGVGKSHAIPVPVIAPVKGVPSYLTPNATPTQHAPIAAGASQRISFAKTAQNTIASIDWSSIVSKAIDSGVKDANKIGAAIVTLLGKVNWNSLGKKAVEDAVPFVVGFVNNLISAMIDEAVHHPVDMIVFITSLIPIGKIAGLTGKLLGDIPLLGPFVKLFTKPLEAAGGIVERSLGKVLKLIFGPLLRRISPFFDGAKGWLVSKGQDILLGLAGGAGKGWRAVAGFFADIAGKVLRYFVGAGKWLLDAGGNLISGLLRGIASKMSGIGSWIKSSVVDPVINAVKGWFGIHSPSTVMHDIGFNLIAGLVRGIVTHDPVPAIKRVFGSLPGALGHLVEKGIVNIKSLPGKALSALGSLGGKIGDFFSHLFGGGDSSGVQQWASTVQQALSMLGLPKSLTGRVLYQMQTESGGNANAINLWDSNAAAGDPSRGLMQVIGSTFSAYHVPGTSRNIYNPLANIAAAINYARARYGPTLESGGMGIGSGHGYDSGGIANGLGFMPKHTLKPERVLSPTQTSAFERLVDVLDGRSGGAAKPSRQKVEFDPRTMEMWIRDLSSQEAGSEIAFRRK